MSSPTACVYRELERERTLESTTQACALTENPAVTSWLIVDAQPLSHALELASLTALHINLGQRFS